MFYLQVVFYVVTICASIVALFQFRYTIIWNKKQLTIKMLSILNDKLQKHFEFLHQTFRYRDLTKPISVEEIHKKMGIFLEDTEKTQDKCDGDNLVDVSGRKFEYNNNGKEIHNKLKNFLNDLEEFCAAVNDKTFDEKQSYRLMRGIIVRAYKYFKPYIEHVRKDHKEVSPIAYKELFQLGERWGQYKI